MELNNKMVENKISELLNNDISIDKNTMNSDNNKGVMYEKEIKQKNQLITELENMLKNEKMKVQSYKAKIENVNKQYAKFQEYKELLNKNITYLQETLIAKEDKINELEKKYLDVSKEISCK